MDDQLHGSTTSGTGVAGRVAAGWRCGFPRSRSTSGSLKSWSTALGESMSDFLVHVVNPVVAVGIGLRRSGRRAARAVLDAPVHGVGLLVRRGHGRHLRHDGSRRAARGLPCSVRRLDRARGRGAGGGLHHVATDRAHALGAQHRHAARREAFYWAAVVSTFALGTAVGDLTAISLHLGYFGSVLLFATLILIPAIGYAVVQPRSDHCVLVRVRPALAHSARR